MAIITVEQREGNVSDLEAYDVTHAVSGRQKNGSRSDTKSQGFIPTTTTTISISDLLEIVKSTYQSVLSKDVLDHFEEERNPDGYYAERTKFSLETPVEETADLIAMHNLSAENLEKALDLGGFPMPSIAVTKSDIPHTNFGDITLVMSKSTVDPRAGKRAFHSSQYRLVFSDILCYTAYVINLSGGKRHVKIQNDRAVSRDWHPSHHRRPPGADEIERESGGADHGDGAGRQSPV